MPQNFEAMLSKYDKDNKGGLYYKVSTTSSNALSTSHTLSLSVRMSQQRAACHPEQP
jgi:hypothetical protein